MAVEVVDSRMNEEYLASLIATKALDMSRPDSIVVIQIPAALCTYKVMDAVFAEMNRHKIKSFICPQEFTVEGMTKDEALALITQKYEEAKKFLSE
jgi:hypothetical protein